MKKLDVLKNSLLSNHSDMGNMATEELTDMVNYMNKETLVRKFCDTTKIKERKAGNYTQFYLRVDGKQYTASTRKALIDKLYSMFCGPNVMTLEEAYHMWMLWRRDTIPSTKTLKENKNEWNRYIAGSELSKMQLAKISIRDFEDFFYSITSNHLITSKRLSNVISVLNGIFNRCVSLGIIPHNVLKDVDRKPFRTRCKPVNNHKEVYSAEEREKILEFLKNSSNGYDMAICFSFYLPLRFSETSAIKYSDIQEGMVGINRAQRTEQKMNNDLTFEARYLTNEERIKGNNEKGFRKIPLVSKASEIAERAHMINPDGEFLFMHNGKQLNGNTFNERLQKICSQLNIPYRSSHQIRFTVATTLFEKGMPINKLSVYLGHTTTAMTWHYIRQGITTEEDFALMELALT